ncbi:MAG: hypothetical protein IBX71_00570 [Candidatus Desulforudis sp.]|nr:hypothetical protein [Desulforudis sp.]
MWDFRLEDEAVLFRERRAGYAFIIDVLGGTPQLALYHVTRFGSKTEYFGNQPPREMLIGALAEQGAGADSDGLYNINPELRLWIEQNII